MLAKRVGLLLITLVFLVACQPQTASLPIDDQPSTFHLERQLFEERLAFHTDATLLALTGEATKDIATYRIADDTLLTMTLKKGTPAIQHMTLATNGRDRSLHHIALAVDPELTLAEAASILQQAALTSTQHNGITYQLHRSEEGITLTVN